MEFPIISSKYDYVNKFINTIAPVVVNEYIARKGQKKLFPSTVIAMACLESGYNVNAESLFGIKGDGVYLPTKEYINNTWISIEDSFKIYPTLSEAVKGLYDLMLWSHYDLATSSICSKDECRALQTCGYATDPDYADKLICIVNDYNLTLFDDYAVVTIEKLPADEDKNIENNSYVVQTGDTLWQIVARYYMLDDNGDIYNKIKEIADYNRIADVNMIYAGQIIILP